uniref:Uncharacterized protein n=1 Tax=Maylandia zebra TaxID=106582 RepID=A0A3P9B3U2_9CICH
MLVGTELPDMGGVLELYPINGSATVEREGLSATLVKDMRTTSKSAQNTSPLLVPSPMWSMAIIYDLVDSMQLHEYGGYGYHHHGYEHGYQDGYHQGYGY